MPQPLLCDPLRTCKWCTGGGAHYTVAGHLVLWSTMYHSLRLWWASYCQNMYNTRNASPKFNRYPFGALLPLSQQTPNWPSSTHCNLVCLLYSYCVLHARLATDLMPTRYNFSPLSLSSPIPLYCSLSVSTIPHCTWHWFCVSRLYIGSAPHVSSA